VAGDVAGHLGCFINLKDSINAITLVCIGTSVPDVFASRLSAVQVFNTTYYTYHHGQVRQKRQVRQVK